MVLDKSQNDPMRSKLSEWKVLKRHAKKMCTTTITSLFEADPMRYENFHVVHENLMLDFSKQLLNAETLSKLVNLAHACGIEEWRQKMFSGAPINITENRAVLHTALRKPDRDPIQVDNEDIMPLIRGALEKMKAFTDNVRNKRKFLHIVNIGIGGSDLASSMAYDALRPFTDRDIQLHFVSNMDGAHLAETLRLVDPKKTLFIVTSKTFTTQETITNAISAREWLKKELKSEDISEHFVAATQNVEEAVKFGIKEENIFPIWDWVGGRYSLWSMIGLCFCIAIGFDHFKQMLAGAHSMDQHFQNAPLEKNLPMLLALTGIWNRNFMGYPALSINPYDQGLWRMPAYMQQLDMESNGKSVDRHNRKIDYKTGPIIFGETGTNAQHAYFQLIHQGTTVVPCDFIMVAKPQHDIAGHHKKLLANGIAQTKALMEGLDHKNPHKSFSGNRPSNTIVINELTPYSFGMLLALYEHKIFVQGIIWNINSFDQCGVELGKVLANTIIEDFDKSINDIESDNGTRGLLDYIRSL